MSDKAAKIESVDRQIRELQQMGVELNQQLQQINTRIIELNGVRKYLVEEGQQTDER
jgi:prefoldin subunit 5